MDVLDDSKGGFRERSVAVGKQAALQKQLQELQKSHQDLSKRYEAKDQKCDELRSKFTATKAALSARERELEAAQRVMQSSTAEKKLLKEDCAEKQVYIRRLEAKLEELQGAADSAIKYQAAKQKIQEQQKQLAAITAELKASKSQVDQQQRELDKANRVLELRISELSEQCGGSSDVPAQLLHSLAESREESLLLAKQLATAKADLQKAKASTSKLSRQLETEQLLRTDAEGAAEALKQRLEKLLDGSKEASKHRTDMAEQLAAAKADADALKTERDQLAEVVLEMQEELEQLKAAAARAQADKEAAVDAAAQQARRELREAQSQAAAAAKMQQQRAAQLNQRCCQLAEQANQLESALQQQVLAAQQTAASRQQQIVVLESQLQTRRQRELELEQQVAELTARVTELSGQINSAEVASKQSSHLERQVARLEAALRVSSVEKQQLQQRLQQQLEDVDSAQQESTREADGLRVQLAAKDVLHRCALQEASQLQGEVQELGQQVQDLAQQLLEAQNAKAQLQETMRQQVADLKDKLKQAQQAQQASAARSAAQAAGHHGQSSCHRHGRHSRSPARRLRSPPLPSTTDWEVAPSSSMQLLAYRPPPVQYNDVQQLQYRSDGAREYACAPSSSPDRSPGRASRSRKAAAAAAAAAGSLSLAVAQDSRGQGSGAPARRHSLTESPGDWGVLSAAGYVGEAAAAAIDAARRGKTLAAARKLHVKQASRGLSAAAGVAGAGASSVLSGLQYTEASSSLTAGALITAYSSGFAAPASNGSSQQVMRSSFELASLGAQSKFPQQQQQQMGAGSVLSQQPRPCSALPIQRPSRSADTSSIRPSHSRTMSCDLTAAAAALDAEVTAVLSGSRRSSPVPASSQRSLPLQPAHSAGSRQGTPTSAAPEGARSDGVPAPSRSLVSNQGSGPFQLSVATAGPAEHHGVPQLLSPRSRHASEGAAGAAGDWHNQAAAPAAVHVRASAGSDIAPAVSDGSSYRTADSSYPHGSSVQNFSAGLGSAPASRGGSPDKRSMRGQQQHQHLQQEQQVRQEQEYASGFCSPHSAAPTPGQVTLAAPLAAATAGHNTGTNEAVGAGVQGPLGAWRQKLSGPVEPYSPSVATMSSQQRARGQTMTDPYSLPASAEASLEACHAEQQQQQWPAQQQQQQQQQQGAWMGAPQQQQQQQPRRAASPLGRASGTSRSADGGSSTGSSPRQRRPASPLGRQQVSALQQQQQQQVQEVSAGQGQQGVRPSQGLKAGHGLKRRSAAGVASGQDTEEGLVGQEASLASAAESSKVSITSAMIEEMSGAWEVPQFSGSEDSDSDSSGRQLVQMLDRRHQQQQQQQQQHQQHKQQQASGAPPAAPAENQGAEQQLLQVLPGPASNVTRNSSSSGGSSHGRVQPPAGPRPSGSGRRSRHVSTSGGSGGVGAAVVAGGGEGIPLDVLSRPASDRSTASFGGRTVSSKGSTSRQYVGDPVGTGCQDLVWQALSDGGHGAPHPPAAAERASSSSSRRISEGSSCNGSTTAAAACRVATDGDSCPVPVTAAAALSPKGASRNGSSGGCSTYSAPGADSSGWQPQQQFHTAAQLLSPPSTCKAPRGGGSRVRRSQDVAHMARPLSEETLSGVHEAPDDSWLMPYDHHQEQQQPQPNLQQQQQQQQQQQRQQQQRQQQRLEQQRRDSSTSERLPANPSLSSWQASGPPSSRVSRGPAAAATAAAAAAATSQGDAEGFRLGPQGSSGIQLSRRSSGSRMEALLDQIEHGVTPSLLDLAGL